MTHNLPVRAILTRESDGLRFEPCFHPGMVRCEACLELVEPAAIKEHQCVEWWTQEFMQASPQARLFPPPKVER